MRRKINRSAVPFLIAIIALFVSGVGLFMPGLAEANFNNYGGNACWQTSCHGGTSITTATNPGLAVFVGINGLVTNTVNVNDGDTINVDFYNFQIMGAGDTSEHQVLVLPSGWTPLPGDASTAPAGWTAWHSSWDGAQGTALGYQAVFTNCSDALNCTDPTTVWTNEQQSGDPYSGGSTGTTCNDGDAAGGSDKCNDLDGTLNLGSDFKVQVPPGTSTGTYFIYINFIGHTDAGARAFHQETLTINVTQTGGGTATTTVTEGTDPGNATICAGDANQAIDAFVLNETSGNTSSTVSAVQVTFNDYTDVGTVYIKSDDGLTTYGSVIPTANIQNVTLTTNITVNASSSTQYKIYVDTAGGASGTLTAYVSAITVTDTNGGSTDTAGTILTFDTTAPVLITNFTAADGEDSQVSLSWTNPADADLAEVIVMRTTGTYPTSHTDGTQVYQNLSPASSGAESPVDTNGPPVNGTTYYYAVFTRDTCGNWNDTVTAGQSADTGTPAATPVPNTTVTDGTDPGDATVCAGDTNQTIDAFDLNETTGNGSETVTNVEITFSDYTDVSAVTVRCGVTTHGSATPNANTYNLTLTTSITVPSLGTESCEIVVDTAGGASGTLTAAVSNITVTTGTVGSITDSSATLTFNTTAPALITDFTAADGENSQVSLSWTNPADADLAEVIVMRKTLSYPTGHTDGTQVYQNLSPVSSGAESPVDTNGPPANGTTYYYAVFTRDTCGNWNDTVTGGQNADTGTPEAPVAPDITNGTLEQYESDGFTLITGGSFTADTTLIMKGTVTDPNTSDSIQLQVEIVTIGGAGFTGTPNCTSGAPVTTGNIAEATCDLTVIFGTADEQYKWRARGYDGALTGVWEEYPN